MLYFSRGSEKDVLDEAALKAGLFEALDKIGQRKKVLAIPPDFTRYHSHAGPLTTYVYDYYKDRLTDVIPAYYMYRIEKELLIKDFSTYFVMLNDPTEYQDSFAKHQYLDLISYLHKQAVDVQPHISPNDMIANF